MARMTAYGLEEMDDLPDYVAQDIATGSHESAERFIERAHPLHRQRLLGLVALCAAEERQSGVMRWCIEEGYDIQQDSLGAALYTEACYDACTVPIWEVLLEGGMDVNRYARIMKFEALGLAIWRDNVDVVTTLLTYGYDPNLAHPVEAKEIGHTAVCQSRSFELITLMLAYGWKPRNTYGETQIAAAELGKIRELNMLINAGADIDAVNREWFKSPRGINSKTCGTPLFRAAMSGQAEAVTHLIERGANVHYRDKSGRSCLWAARYGGNLTIIEAITRARHGDALA